KEALCFQEVCLALDCHLYIFLSGSSTRILVFISGLTEGFLHPSYVVLLAKKLQEIGWSFVHVLLSSSYLGYGTSSLHQDAEEIHKLIEYLYMIKVFYCSFSHTSHPQR